MKTCLIAIDGVVRKLMGGAPIAEGIQAWAEITSQVAHTAKMKARDARLRGEE
jgi:hypothetical protein